MRVLNIVLCHVQWWEGELERGFELVRARRIREASPLSGGMESHGRHAMEGERGEEEREREAMVEFVLDRLAPELFIELMDTFHRAPPPTG